MSVLEAMLKGAQMGDGSNPTAGMLPNSEAAIKI